jgi:hypothetical protein
VPPGEPDTIDPGHGPRPGTGLPAGAFIGSNIPGFSTTSPNTFLKADGTELAPDPGGDPPQPPGPGGVPEPSAWALLIAGFGLAGGALRRSRARARRRTA